MSLEAFQSGLSWAIILRKREGFRAAFAGFDPEVVAGFGTADVERLLADAGIVRNRLKIEATISNARTLVGLDDVLLRPAVVVRADERPAPRRIADVPATTPESIAMAKELKRAASGSSGPPRRTP